MNTLLRNANLKRKDPFSFELAQLRSEIAVIKDLATIKDNGLSEIVEVVIEKKFEGLKQNLLEQLELYIGDVTEELVSKNLKGDKGDKGDRGEQGLMGERGPAGERGLVGERGISGINGKDGTNGKDGRNGRDGKDGKDGKSVTAEEVVAIIRPDIDKFLMEINKSIRSMKADRGGSGGGGGLSSPTTFSFTGDGLTTTFTLSTRVAANGRAIWAYVNGQWIQPGTHFSVSDRILTTTFTPASGDIIEGFYLRT